ncbi:hypothetical protein GALL_479280 [mine drainage metagenome]|uniref:Uncharacterized protein n=1 Tax=mine drainage metagenome TaxID=410659 RepID=A0A1J5PS91_9ZZZZ
MGFVRCQHVDLLVAMHGVPQIQARAKFQVTCFKDTFKQQNRASPAQVAHPLGFIQIKQGKTVGAAQAFEGTFDAVAIGIGLDDGP